jgi:hypothetical protein
MSEPPVVFTNNRQLRQAVAFFLMSQKNMRLSAIYGV